ncbi:hypothetical protein [Caballeronia humi]|uniref:Uncharacterized protein n=1 Tax=Caballeronia humi TaxID=326474 RepID=A0A158ET78_9BURK|nr:hypothetical protein [Caballeronia humi]SAL09840.1 hypothetical protein AWB65_00081 [Caballeronia humi]
MPIHFQSSHLVAVIAIGLLTALPLTVRLRPQSWRGVLFKALVANIGAFAAVIAFEILTE